MCAVRPGYSAGSTRVLRVAPRRRTRRAYWVQEVYGQPGGSGWSIGPRSAEAVDPGVVDATNRHDGVRRAARQLARRQATLPGVDVVDEEVGLGDLQVRDDRPRRVRPEADAQRRPDGGDDHLAAGQLS